MAVYQVSIKKRVHRHERANQYIIVLDTPFSRDELDYIADSVPPRLISFERIFLSEEVELLYAEITPICQPPEPWMAWRAADSQSHIPRSITGLRPMAIEETTGPAITLVLGLQPTANHWGRKDYRYALHRDEVQISSRGYHLHIHAQKEMDLRLSQAKLQRTQLDFCHKMTQIDTRIRNEMKSTKRHTLLFISDKSSSKRVNPCNRSLAYKALCIHVRVKMSFSTTFWFFSISLVFRNIRFQSAIPE